MRFLFAIALLCAPSQLSAQQIAWPPAPHEFVSPDQIESVIDATALLVDQQDVTPLGLAYQAIEMQTSEDALDVALRRVLRAMRV